MAGDHDSVRGTGVPFFRTASDDELVDVEAFIVAYCNAHVRAQSVWVAVRGKRRNWQRNLVQLRERRCKYGRTLPYGGHLREYVKEEMRTELESAAHGGALTLRDKFGHNLATLPNRRQFDPLRGIYTCSADLEAFARLHWNVGKAPQAIEEHPAAAAESDALPLRPEAAASPMASVRQAHRLAKLRTNVLDPLINLARQAATDPDNSHAVFAELVRMARQGVAPLLEFIDGEGIKYQAENGVRFLTSKNLADRLRRASKRAS